MPRQPGMCQRVKAAPALEARHKVSISTERQQKNCPKKCQKIVQKKPCTAITQAEPPQPPNVKHKGLMGHPNVSGLYPARGALLGCDASQMTHTQVMGASRRLLLDPRRALVQLNNTISLPFSGKDMSSNQIKK